MLNGLRNLMKRIPFLVPLVQWIRARRSKRLAALEFRRAIRGKSPVRVVVGASGVFENEWTPTDRNLLDITSPRDWSLLFDRESLDAVLGEHVWEHLTEDQGVRAAALCRRYLKEGGRLRIAVPDGNHPDPEYIDYVRPGGSGAGAEDHRVLYTHASLERMLKKAGFTVRKYEYFDESNRFVRRDWNPDQGMIHRSFKFDSRNKDGQPNYTSIIMDGIK